MPPRGPRVRRTTKGTKYTKGMGRVIPFLSCVSWSKPNLAVAAPIAPGIMKNVRQAVVASMSSKSRFAIPKSGGEFVQLAT